MTVGDFYVVGKQLEKFKDKDPGAFENKTRMKFVAIAPAHAGWYRVSLSDAEKVGTITSLLPPELKEPLQKPLLKELTLYDYLVLYSQVQKYEKSHAKFSQIVELPTFGGFSGVVPNPVGLVIDP